MIDIRDPDCANVEGGFELVCQDGIDNNNNGQIDCKDPDCQGRAFCLVETQCDDGISNDLDDLVDCDDSDCDATCIPEFIIEICNNDRDDDNNGQTDCADDQCSYSGHCYDEG